MNTTDWIQALSALSIVVLTIVLAYLTRKYADANVRMAKALERDIRERYRPFVDVEVAVAPRESWICNLEIVLANKGLAPLRIDRLVVSCGKKVFHEARDLLLAIGESRNASVRFSLHDLAFETFTEGQRVELELAVEYRDAEEGLKKIVRQPWLEYRERPRAGATHK